MSTRIYKIFRETEWDAFHSAGKFSGSVHDLRDGFIHLSTKEQVPGVLARYFQGEEKVYVVEFLAETLAAHGTLQWEQSKTGEKYPHLYEADLRYDLIHNNSVAVVSL